MVITVTYEELDRMFYERLRRGVVAMGLMPDITLFDNDADYFAARRALRTSLNAQGLTLLEVIGVGSWDDKGEESDAKIVVKRLGTDSGSIGGFPATYYESYNDTAGDIKFEKSYFPDTSDDVNYEIRLLSNNVKMERILSRVVDNALGRRRFVQTVNPQGEYTETRVLLFNRGSFDFSAQKFIEKGYRYVIADVFLQEPQLILSDIPLLTTLQFCVYLPDTETPVCKLIEVFKPPLAKLVRVVDIGKVRIIGVDKLRAAKIT